MTAQELYDDLKDKLSRYPKCANEEVKIYFDDDEHHDTVVGTVLRTEGVAQDHLHFVLDIGESTSA